MNGMATSAGVFAVFSAVAVYLAREAWVMGRAWSAAGAICAAITFAVGCVGLLFLANAAPNANLWGAVGFGNDWECTGVGLRDRFCARDLPPCLRLDNAGGVPANSPRCRDAR